MASESSVEENDSVAQGNCSNDSSAIQNMECVKRCGLDHEVLLQDCRERYCKLKELEEGLTGLRKRLHQMVAHKRSVYDKLQAVDKYKEKICHWKTVKDNEHLAKQKDEKELVLCQNEISVCENLLYRRTCGFLKGQHAWLKMSEAQQRESQKSRNLCSQLQRLRCAMVTQANRDIFRIEVEPVTIDDEGETPTPSLSQSPLTLNVDVNADIEVEDQWILSGYSRLPSPRIRINDAPLPMDGNYNEYHTTDYTGSDPTKNPSATISAGLSAIAQYVWLLSRILAVSTPHPLSLQTAIREYSRTDLKKKMFAKKVAQLNDNIVYLCMTQSIPSSALIRGATISNLMNLIMQPQIGWNGPFVIEPEVFSSNHRMSASSLSDSMFSQAPPSTFPVSPPSEVEEEEEDEEQLAIWEEVRPLASEEASLHMEFMPAPIPRSVKGDENTDGDASASGKVFTTVSGLWNSMSKLWGK